MFDALREKSLSYLIVGPFAIVLAFPFYVMVITAFKNGTEFYDATATPYWFKTGPTWDNVRFLVHPSFTVPFSTWLLMGFFKTIPQELEDAAQIDGASRLKTLVRVVFPISIPGILTVVIFSFSLVLNEFVYAFTFISSTDHRTLSTGVYTDLIRGDLPEWGAIMVAALIPSIPLALLYNAFLNRFIAGFTGGAFR